MAHLATDNLTPEEKSFMEMIQRGDDFFKIELLRHAKSCYKKAAEIFPDKEIVKQKLDDCNKQLAFEKKVTLIIVAVALVALAVYFIVQ
jgi:hypothetical protein